MSARKVGERMQTPQPRSRSAALCGHVFLRFLQLNTLHSTEVLDDFLKKSYMKKVVGGV